MGKKESIDSLKEKLEEWKRLKKHKQEIEKTKRGQMPVWSAGTKTVSKPDEGNKRENNPASRHSLLYKQTPRTTIVRPTANKPSQSEKKQVSKTNYLGRRENSLGHVTKQSPKFTANQPKGNCKSLHHLARRKSGNHLQFKPMLVSKSKDQIPTKKQMPIWNAGTRTTSKPNVNEKENKMPSRHSVLYKQASKTTIVRSTGNKAITTNPSGTKQSFKTNNENQKDRRHSLVSKVNIAKQLKTSSKISHHLSRRMSGGHLQFQSEIANRPKDQTSMRHQLNGWLKAKGKTPSKFRHLMCFGAEMSARKNNQECQAKRALTVDELTEQQKTLEKEEKIAVNLLDHFLSKSPDDEGLCLVADPCEQLQTMLTECLTLFEAGCPHNDILAWLTSIEQNVPLAKQCTDFYVTKVKVLRSREYVDSEEILAILETAIRNSAKPTAVLASFITQTVKEMLSGPMQRESLMLPAITMTPRKSDVMAENIFQSSSVKFCLKDITPLKKRGSRSIDGLNVDAPRCVVTPVRRSTRRSLATLPEALQDKQQVFTSITDISESDLKNALFQKNSALKTDTVSVKKGIQF